MNYNHLHPVRVEGKVTLSDGSETSFSIQPDCGWQQWGNVQEKLGVTVGLMEQFAHDAHEDGLREPDEDEGDAA